MAYDAKSNEATLEALEKARGIINGAINTVRDWQNNGNSPAKPHTSHTAVRPDPGGKRSINPETASQEYQNDGSFLLMQQKQGDWDALHSKPATHHPTNQAV